MTFSISIYVHVNITMICFEWFYITKTVTGTIFCLATAVVHVRGLRICQIQVVLEEIKRVNVIKSVMNADIWHFFTLI